MTSELRAIIDAAIFDLSRQQMRLFRRRRRDGGQMSTRYHEALDAVFRALLVAHDIRNGAVSIELIDNRNGGKLQ